MIPSHFIIDGIKISLLEARAISLTIQGLPRQDIADVMKIDVGTHNKRMNRLFLKFRMSSAISLVVFALGHGFTNDGYLNDVDLFKGNGAGGEK